MLGSRARLRPESVAGLHSTPPSRLVYQPNVLTRSFLLERSGGNVLVYNSRRLSSVGAQLAQRGGATRLLLNHAHEAMYGDPRLGVPTSVHERDRRETERSLPTATTFTGREVIDDDLEVIPTPGHTAGTTSYLWDTGRHRLLFTGDFIWIEHGEWKAVVLDEDLRADYLASLALVRDLDFDVLVPWGTTTGDPCLDLASPSEIRSRIDAISARVEAGADR